MRANNPSTKTNEPFTLGKNFFDGKKGCKQSYVEAFYHFSEALLNDNKNPELYCYRGRCLMSQGYFIEALFDFSWSIKIEVERKAERERREKEEPSKIILEDAKKK